MNKTNRNMLEGPLFPNIIQYTVPIILTSLLQLLFNAADLVVVGSSAAACPSPQWAPPVPLPVCSSISSSVCP